VLKAAELCQFLSFVLHGSGLTPLKCGEIYNLDFVVSFMENMTEKKWKSVNICQCYERMYQYSGTVFWDTVYKAITSKFDEQACLHNHYSLTSIIKYCYKIITAVHIVNTASTLYTWPYVPLPTTSIKANVPAGSC